MNSLRSRANLLAILSIACGLEANAQQASPPDPDPTRFEADIRAFEDCDRQNSFPRDSVLFVGSSSIRMWPTAESFPNMPVINRGFGGSHISDVNYFAARIVVKYKPRVIVFYAGDNDIAVGKSPLQVFEDFQLFVQRVHEQLSATRIVYLPIKPSIARWPMWPSMQTTNALVDDAAKTDERVEYIDTAMPMLGEDGRPRKELFLEDGLHLNARGYALWDSILSPILEESVETK
jgi:lysophospholipase L1-like esterase